MGFTELSMIYRVQVHSNRIGLSNPCYLNDQYMDKQEYMPRHYNWAKYHRDHIELNPLTYILSVASFTVFYHYKARGNCTIHVMHEHNDWLKNMILQILPSNYKLTDVKSAKRGRQLKHMPFMYVVQHGNQYINKKLSLILCSGQKMHLPVTDQAYVTFANLEASKNLIMSMTHQTERLWLSKESIIPLSPLFQIPDTFKPQMELGVYHQHNISLSPRET